MAEWDMAEAIEADLEKSLTMGLTEDEMVKFVQTVMEIRKVMPKATVCGVFGAALLCGLDYVHTRLAPMPDAKRTRKGKLSGKGL